MLIRRPLLCVLTVLAVTASRVAVGADNLLPNGGFEQDADGDGVADGWQARPGQFSRETEAAVEAYIAGLPAAAELLRRDRISASDGTVLYECDAAGEWPAAMLRTAGHWGEYERSWDRTENWYDRLRREELPRASRPGEGPLPAGLDLGRVTLMLSERESEHQVISEPITVAADTGYALHFWVRTSGGTEYWWGPQVLDGTSDPAAVPVSPQPSQHYDDPKVVNSIPRSYWWGAGIAGRHWARMRLPFRTGPNCRSIRIRLPYHHRDAAGRASMNNKNYRIWYDALRLAEDATVLGAGPTNAGAQGQPSPNWPAADRERGFVVAARPTLPVPQAGWVPAAAETEVPIRLALCAGERDSVVILVRNLLKEKLVVAAAPGALASDDGYGLHAGYGGRFISIRAAELTYRFLTSKRFVTTPKYLRNSSELTVRPGSTGQFWMTVAVPAGTPAGDYEGTVSFTRRQPAPGTENAGKHSVPFVLTVRSIDLEAAAAAFFTWHHTAPVRGDLGPAHALPGAGDIYLADQRRHGMNTVAMHCYAERRDADGNYHAAINELDAMVLEVQRAGLCSEQPLLLHTWRDGGVGGEFCEFGAGADTVRAIVRRGKRAGWPEVLFGVLDEPNTDERATRVAEVVRTQFARARRRGVRTATAGGYPGTFVRPLSAAGDTLGDLYDVWIEAMYAENWDALHAAARRNKAELWMYNCWVTGAGYLQERFYAGVWTWRTGVAGNGVWSYGWYVRIADSAVPESSIAWEGRLAGVNDYRYLQTLESALAAARRRGRGAAAAREAHTFLADLRRRIPDSVYRYRPGAIPQNQWAELDTWNPVPAIRPQDYDHIRRECTRHILALRSR